MAKKFWLGTLAVAAGLALAGCGNPSDGTAWNPPGAGGGNVAPGAALVGTWGTPPAITFNADGTGFLYNPTPFNWTATATAVTLTNAAGGEPFSITANWAIIENNLNISNPAGTGEAALAIITAIAEGASLPMASEDGFLGATLNLSGQVWEWERDDDGNYVRFTGDRTVTSQCGEGSGAITDGQLSFSIGTPLADYWHNAESFFWWEGRFADFSISVPEARTIHLSIMMSTGERLDRSQSRFPYGDSLVQYLFVDQDVVITGSGRTTTGTFAGTDVQTTTQDINLNLRAGWNALYSRTEVLDRADGFMVQQIAYSLSDPAYLRWKLTPPPPPPPPAP